MITRPWGLGSKQSLGLGTCPAPERLGCTLFCHVCLGLEPVRLRSVWVVLCFAMYAWVWNPSGSGAFGLYFALLCMLGFGTRPAPERLGCTLLCYVLYLQIGQQSISRPLVLSVVYCASSAMSRHISPSHHAWPVACAVLFSAVSVRRCQRVVRMTQRLGHPSSGRSLGPQDVDMV